MSTTPTTGTSSSSSLDESCSCEDEIQNLLYMETIKCCKRKELQLRLELAEKSRQHDKLYYQHKILQQKYESLLKMASTHSLLDKYEDIGEFGLQQFREKIENIRSKFSSGMDVSCLDTKTLVDYKETLAAYQNFELVYKIKTDICNLGTIIQEVYDDAQPDDNMVDIEEMDQNEFEGMQVAENIVEELNLEDC